MENYVIVVIICGLSKQIMIILDVRVGAAYKNPHVDSLGVGIVATHSRCCSKFDLCLGLFFTTMS